HGLGSRRPVNWQLVVIEMTMYTNNQRWYVTLSFYYTKKSPTHNYTLSLHDALPISPEFSEPSSTTLELLSRTRDESIARKTRERDRKSTRLNSSHVSISYAVFCLKKKKHRSKIT